MYEDLVLYTRRNARDIDSIRRDLDVLCKQFVENNNIVSEKDICNTDTETLCNFVISLCNVYKGRNGDQDSGVLE